jgi:anti-sigma regulatory factor (Ser/Thr protein kinase)
MVIPAELAELERLANWAEEFGRSTKLHADLLFAIQLCIEEAVANIIMYSGAAEQRQEVAVELVQTGTDVLAIIEDGGRSFDPTAMPPRRKPASLEEAPVGDLGIHLMRSFATDMHYERRDGRNRLTLRFSPAQAA